jgi:TonB family protein
MLPAIVQQKYVVAKAAFDSKDYATAMAGFSQVIETLADPDLRVAASKPPLSDMGTLAMGFRDLSAKSIPPPAPPEPVAAAPPPPAQVAAVPSRIYNRGELHVTAPVILRQDLPPFPRNIGPMADGGVLEIVINENGVVETATMRTSVNPRYDSLAIAATRNWRYRPALVAGTPVKFRKQISISLKPGN